MCESGCLSQSVGRGRRSSTGHPDKTDAQIKNDTCRSSLSAPVVLDSLEGMDVHMVPPVFEFPFGFLSLSGNVQGRYRIY